MSLVRRHRERMAARLAALATPARAGNALEDAAEGALASTGGTALAGAAPRNPTAAQLHMRLVHDLRRLKEIKSVQAKVEAKRSMLPEYEAWIEGWLAAIGQTGEAREDEIVGTMMVWKIDTGDYVGALQIAEPMLAHNLPLPARYARDTATLVTEEIADAALTALGRGGAFDLSVLQRTESLVTDKDMHDEVKAKLFKAIGLEFLRRAEQEANLDEKAVLQASARDALVRARNLHDRVGVKKEIERLERALARGTEPAIKDTGNAGCLARPPALGGGSVREQTSASPLLTDPHRRKPGE